MDSCFDVPQKESDFFHCNINYEIQLDDDLTSWNRGNKHHLLTFKDFGGVNVITNFHTNATFWGFGKLSIYSDKDNYKESEDVPVDKLLRPIDVFSLVVQLYPKIVEYHKCEDFVLSEKFFKELILFVEKTKPLLEQLTDESIWDTMTRFQMCLKKKEKYGRYNRIIEFFFDRWNSKWSIIGYQIEIINGNTFKGTVIRVRDGGGVERSAETFY